MRKTTRFTVTTLVALLVISAANTASAGEPEHGGFWLKPIAEFYNFFSGWF